MKRIARVLITRVHIELQSEASAATVTLGGLASLVILATLPFYYFATIFNYHALLFSLLSFHRRILGKISLASIRQLLSHPRGGWVTPSYPGCEGALQVYEHVSLLNAQGCQQSPLRSFDLARLMSDVLLSCSK